jgi:prepilin-type N-terminal cleavage/methylation domain-containing protein
MPRLITKTKSRTPQHAGFSIIELLAVMTVLTIVTAFGVIGVSKARASVRLSGAAREYAAYVEKARMYSIRRHGDDAATRASVIANADKLRYDVTMDLDGDGGMDTRTISLPSGVRFDTVESIAFDWRGRTVNIVDGVDYPNSQVSVRLVNDDDSVSVDVTGSGDVTIDSEVFDDNVPNVSLHVADLAAGATPTPSETTPDASPSTSPVIGGLPDVTASPLPDLTGGLPGTSPSPTASVSPSPVATATPTPTPRANPTPSPSPVTPCTIDTDPVTVIMGTESTATVKVSHNSETSVSVSGNSSKASDLQVSPNAAQTIAAGGSTSFTIKSKKTTGTYYVTFSAGCGSKAVIVTVF